MSRRDRLRTLLGFTAAVAIVAALAVLVGVEEFLSALVAANLALVGVVGVVTLGWFLAWGMALRSVLSSLDSPVSRVRGFLLYGVAAFANNVTPFGQAGGEPVTALYLSRTTKLEYERGLAAIASVDTVNLLPSTAFALVAVLWLGATATVGGDVLLAAVAAAVAGVTLLILATLAWRFRTRLADAIAPRIAGGLSRLAGVIPSMSAPTTDGIRRRIDGFLGAIRRVGTDRRRLAVTVSWSTIGWACQVLALWLALWAVGAPIPIAVAALVVPLGAVAGGLPLPGGAGGIEGALVALLVAAPVEVTAAAALAGVIVFRGFVYWLPVVVGGTVVGLNTVREAGRS
ncbi:putative flippase [Halalkaliarchaeum sp. AArc-CO]|uniref:lysylphosphatidylglycerol synthase transmembrane domain-containing protein n=1 Tax=Halalkaliarchaeum sp. AArc-CO TaxID=2866381 RepID=UPI00217E56D0|nr:lysylphosphatidylglycerol synthase transmembrane domain-containing protein [Halalkaliarchaeum sp. AArc-CO]UWG49829.1 putative flippase [Halalkaliarchaeum sp. AArc-CO]